MEKRLLEERIIYSEDFRESALEEALTNNRPYAQTAELLGIKCNTLYNWINKHKMKKSLKTSSTTRSDNRLISEKLTSPEQSELRSLKREVARLKEENEILKKASAYFAKELG